MLQRVIFLGTTYQSMGMYEYSLADFNGPLEIKPNDEITLLNLGFTYRKMGLWKYAVGSMSSGR